MLSALWAKLFPPRKTTEEIREERISQIVAKLEAKQAADREESARRIVRRLLRQDGC